jgi:acyl-CoA synthetase (AMP-forming)/AMP-acid ligase II
VKLVDDAGQEVPEGTVGHLLISGDNVTAGYFNNPALNAATISADGWLNTGDLALKLADELYVTGRSKEIIFVNGQNYYPHDLEAVLQAEPGLELGKVIAAGARTPGSATEELVLFVLHRSDMNEFLPLATRAMHLVNEHAGVEVARVVPVKRIPKTTSGKLQRGALAKAYEDGEFARRSASSTVHGPPSTVTVAPPRVASSLSSRQSLTTRCRASTSTWTTTCSTLVRARSR